MVVAVYAVAQCLLPSLHTLLQPLPFLQISPRILSLLLQQLITPPVVALGQPKLLQLMNNQGLNVFNRLLFHFKFELLRRIDGILFDERNHIVLNVLGQFQRLLWFGSNGSLEDDEDLFEGILSYYEFADVIGKFVEWPWIKYLGIAHFSQYPEKLLYDGVLL